VSGRKTTRCQTAQVSVEPAYLTAAQVSDLLQVDEKTVLRWSLQDASMPVLRRGRVVRFPRERLLVWLERQEPRAARRQAQGQHKSSTA
jgi:excisionase family DNA binding protein